MKGLKEMKKKTNLKEMFFIVFHRKTILKSIEIVLKYTGRNCDLATRKKIENGLIHPIRESIKQKKERKKQKCKKSR